MNARTALILCTPILSALIYGLGAIGQDIKSSVFAYGASFIPYLFFVGCVQKRIESHMHLRQVLFSVGIAGLILLYAEPILSEDIWRYVWDGFQLSDGRSPYCAPPSSPSETSFAMAYGLEEVRANIGHDHLPTIYPPLAITFFSISSFFDPSTVPIRILSVLTLLICIWVLARLLKAQTERTALIGLFAFNPLLLVETAVSGHVDIFGICLVLIAIYFAQQKANLWSAILLGCSILTKLIPILIAPVLWNRRLRYLVACLLTVVLGYSLVWTSDCNSLGSLSTFSGKWRHNAGLFDVIHYGYSLVIDGELGTLSIPNLLSQWTTGESQLSEPTLITMFLTKSTSAVLGLGLIFYLLRQHLSPVEKMCGVFTALFIFSPVVHPWYLTWILPVLPYLWLRGGLGYAAPILWWSCFVLVAYEARIHFVYDGLWQSSTILTVLEYSGIFVLMIYARLRSRRISPPANQ